MTKRKSPDARNAGANLVCSIVTENTLKIAPAGPGSKWCATTPPSAPEAPPMADIMAVIVARIRRRYGLPDAIARTVVGLSGWGGRQ